MISALALSLFGCSKSTDDNAVSDTAVDTESDMESTGENTDTVIEGKIGTENDLSHTPENRVENQF